MLELLFAELGIEVLKTVLMIGLPVGAYALLTGNNGKIQKIFIGAGIHTKAQGKKEKKKYPLIYSMTKNDYGEEYSIYMPEGLSMQDLEKNKGAIEHGLGCKIELMPSINQMVVMKTYMKPLQSERYSKVNLKGLNLLIGKTHTGILSHELNDEYPHMVIGGTSGSGKSVNLRSIITNLILNNNARYLHLHLCDLKLVEFEPFRKSSFVVSISNNVEEASYVMLALKKEMFKRLELFRKLNVVNITEHNKVSKVKLAREVLLIDELANLTLQSKEATQLLNELLQMARAVGIHCILATQRPDKDVLPGLLKANIQATIAFKVRNKTNSIILLDHEGAEALRGKGHGILQSDNETEFQGYYLEVKDCIELIKHTYVEKHDVDDTSGVISI